MFPSLPRLTSLFNAAAVRELSTSAAQPKARMLRTNRGSLRSKLVLALAAMFLAILTVNEIVGHVVISPEFMVLERSSAIRDAHRVRAAIEGELEHFKDLNQHWATSLASANSADWNNTNLLWACIVDSDGTTLWLHGQEFDSDPTIAKLLQLVATSTSNKQSNDNSNDPSGILRTENSCLAFFSASPIPIANPDSLSTSPASRQLMVGRKFTANFLARIREQTQVNFSIQPPKQPNSSDSMVLWETADALMVEFPLPCVPIADISTAASSTSDASEAAPQPSSANIFIRLPHQIVSRADHTFSLARNLFILGSVSAILSLLLILQFLVVSPLNCVRDHFNSVGVDGATPSPLALDCDDEIGDLSRAFDAMIKRLNETQQQLSDASQASGRSEVAATVIHNVGNVLTNVNSLIDTATNRVGTLRVEPLQMLACQLQEPDGSPELMQATPKYLEGLAIKWKSDKDSLAEILATLNDNVKHIHDVIRDQQKYADHKIEYRTVDIASVLSDAIACCEARLNENLVRVAIIGDPNMTAIGDASLLLQTIINIISNATQAMTHSQPDSRTLTIKLTQNSDDLHIAISDSGCGMTPETLARVFDAHFTLREGGTGLGLHFCANTIKQLGGSIHATSDGMNQGSKFVIQLARPKTNSPHPSDTAATTHHRVPS
ncbi:ATP-binding protein [Rubripirellula reticaptiva]|uniref:histidine kinase n=1 Tax=Rubripirellula reticaptiva TaxID=2528013 RepID=A0A5C6FC88_9BACT|nr:ATP-binding protein [Rubripirellula reticaptiva]TWU58230.1 Sensor histidine kinase TmoS [Rubripirellula reticaptiva]